MITTESSSPTEYHDVGITNAFGDEALQIEISGGNVGREWSHTYCYRLPHPMAQRLQDALEPLAYSITDDHARHRLTIKCAALIDGLRIWSRIGEKLTIRAKSRCLKITINTIQRSK